MNNNSPNTGVLIGNSVHVDAVSWQMIRERAVALALINGRRAEDATKSDWDRAKRELTGLPRLGEKQAVIESSR